ncbi:hypothetical protein [Legionella nagasakiensis]|uniref:hypothetical protein n=1 Tax=Legionella nagasakiensis TaxID=535290 RepID=UPI001055CE48|nr:hypothetical protein [Legionella nagasakiensis]
MPSPIDTLSRDKKLIAEQIIGGMRALIPYVQNYKEQVHEFKEGLASADSSDAFITIVRRIIAMEKELFDLKLRVMEGMDEEIAGALSQHVVEDRDLMAVMELFQDNGELTRSIREAKQRLSRSDLFSDLSTAQQDVLNKFIHDVLELEKVVGLLKPVKERYQQRLQEATSHDEVDEIEREITANGEALAALYRKTVSYPEDEETAGVLIKYLEANRELLLIIRDLDGGFSESLDDDVLAARATIASAASPRM